MRELPNVDQVGVIFINGKPFRGRISHWYKCQSREPYSLGWYIKGYFLDHPVFKLRMGHTSDVLATYSSPKGELIETRNSVYLLMERSSWSGWNTDGEGPVSGSLIKIAVAVSPL